MSKQIRKIDKTRGKNPAAINPLFINIGKSKDCTNNEPTKSKSPIIKALSKLNKVIPPLPINCRGFRWTQNKNVHLNPHTNLKFTKKNWQIIFLVISMDGIYLKD